MGMKIQTIAKKRVIFDNYGAYNLTERTSVAIEVPSPNVRVTWFSSIFFTVPLQASDENSAKLLAHQQMLNLVRLDKEYTKVPLAVFEALGWDIPDNGKTVKALAEKAYRGAGCHASGERVDLREHQDVCNERPQRELGKDQPPE